MVVRGTGGGWMKTGPKPRPLVERFQGKYQVDADGHWIWIGAKAAGYGRILGEGGRYGRLLGAHVASYLIHRGPIPDGYDLDHLCRIRACVNPDHLEAVTRAENNRRVGLGRDVLGRFTRARQRSPTGLKPDRRLL